MTDVLIKRELLERANSLLCSYSSTLTDRAVTRRAISEICAILAAPRQPEGEGLEVVAYRYKVAYEFGGEVMCWEPNGRKVLETFPLADHADAQRAIAELREVNRIQLEVASVHGAACVEIRKERDTLRQQLAERDAEIERLRVKLMTIASAEPGRHNIEWAKAMAATGNNEAYAKWRAAFDQRDKLAKILRDLVPGCKWRIMRPRIDAALAEIDNGNE